MKTAVITGASYGIGESITEALLKEGWKVYGVSRSKPGFQNERFVWLKCDLSEPAEISDCLRAIEEPMLDVLVSNAGIIELEKASAVTRASYEKTFSVNVLAPMLLVNALRDKISHATVISISSVSDRIPEANMALYSSSKAANTIYFDALADELKEAKVYVLLPDYVDTPMQHQINGDSEDFDWTATIKAGDVARICRDLISGNVSIESGANMIIVTEKLKDDLKSVEKIYGLNVETNELDRL